MGAGRQTGKFVVRPRLLSLLRGVQNRIVVLSAPSGYGKTTVAQQYLEASDDVVAVWIEASGHHPSPQEFLSLVIGAFSRDWPGLDRGVNTLVASLREDDLMKRAVDVLGVTPREKLVCLVIDDVGLGDDWMACLAALLGITDRNVMAVVTSRTAAGVLSTDIDAFVITSEMLRFTSEETILLLTHMCPGFPEEGVPNVLRFTQGQAALLALSLPYSVGLERYDLGMNHGDAFPTLKSQLLKLAESQLDLFERHVLFVAAVFGEGTVTELAVVLDCEAVGAITAVAEAVPLVYLEPDGRFVVHSIAQDVFLGSQWSEAACGIDRGPCVRRVLCQLAAQRRFPRLLTVLESHTSDYERCEALEVHGEALLASGFMKSCLSCVESVRPAVLLTCPRVIFLLARLLRETGNSEEAEAKAAAARSLAMAEGDSALLAEIVVFMARRWLETGREAEAYDSLSTAIEALWSSMPGDLRAMMLSFHAVAATVIGAPTARQSSLRRLEMLLADEKLSEEASGRARLYQAYVEGPLRGDWGSGALLFRQAATTCSLGMADSLTAKGNLAAALVELGRVDEAAGLVEEVLEASAAHGLAGHYNSFQSLKSLIASVTGGDYATATGVLRTTAKRFDADGDHFYAFQERLYLAAMLRATGDVDAALSVCQGSMEYFASRENVLYRLLSTIETAASLAASGELSAARTLAGSVVTDVDANGLPQQSLKAAMVLAVCDYRANRWDDAVHRLVPHADYVSTDGANWQIAMYIRTFPELLAILSAAMPASEIPWRLRNLLSPGDVAAGVAAAKRIDTGPSQVLQRSLTSRLDSSNPNDALCLVRMLGRLSVLTPRGPVPARAWRKRKARVLFAMLVVKRGQDVPRDQILEHLWPDMDEVRARNNFYVVWSAMKSALMGVVSRSEPCPYVESIGGVCRVVRENLHTDLDDFDEQLERARVAEGSGRPSEAIAAYKALMGIYRGDLLPGDLYDDWFSSAREHYRQEFTDAMLRGAALHEQHGMPEQALRMVRAALAFNSWREDLYRAAIRYQMATGQRGAAIETYVACRTKLSEDLGLDPSAETRRLYEDILAMEEASDNAFA